VYETDNGNLVASSASVRAESVEELVEKAAVACAEMYEKFVSSQGSRQKKLEKFVIVVRANPAKGGTVLRNPNQDEYTSGASVDIAAVPAKDYVFTGWSGAMTDAANPVTVTMDDNKMLMANFKYIDQNAAAKGHKLAAIVSPEDGGFAARYPDAKGYADKERVIVTATAARGYKFTGWSDGNQNEDESMVMITKNRDLTLTMDGDKSVKANFKRIVFDRYFSMRYQFPLGTMSETWGGVDLEWGWLWGNGAYWGIDIGGGGDADAASAGLGFNLGGAYNIWDRLQILYGGSVGFWWLCEFDKYVYTSEYDDYYGDGYTYTDTDDQHYLSFFAPLVKLRYGPIELMYRGLLGTKLSHKDESGKDVKGVFGWHHHQLMLGLHVAGSKRWWAQNKAGR